MERGGNNSIIVEEGVKLHNYKLDIRGVHNTIIIRKKCNIRGSIEMIGSNLTVEIGENTHINGATINCREKSIYIGTDCLFSNEIKIRTFDVHKIFDKNTKEQINKAKNDIVIADRVWIGQDVFIGKNSIIHNDSIVGTKSFITKDMKESNVIIGGYNEILKRDVYWEK